MSVSGLCAVCNHSDVEHTCDRCGSLVCDKHWDAETGFCVECASEVCPPARGETSDSEDRPDGVDTYRF
ncbi:hypothetical protein ACFQJ5_15120 [Halomicroarcula sp. GCM10025324]|uniref:hypothetical protein n=1 Tax=Haloarcula TaxID=2237 RepID=UPI0023E88E07|nr:hypothetical protein [Halomicroarcula sp. ZS-22-S1]